MSRPFRFEPRVLTALSLAAIAGLTACGSGGGGEGGSGGGDNPGNAISIEGSLPDSDWAGTITVACPDSQHDLEYTAGIAGNVLITDFSDGETQGTSLDAFQYTATGAAEWLGLDGQPIGACAAQGNELRCETFADQEVQEKRTLTFFDTTLRWDAQVTAGGETCTNKGDLARR